MNYLFNMIIISLFVSPSYINTETDLAQVYEQGDRNTQQFIRSLAIFISSFLKAHLELMENR